MADLITVRCAGGTIRITDTHAIVRVVGQGERVIARSAISEVRISVYVWYIFGFTRSLTLYVTGQGASIKLNNMSKRNAKAVKAALGF